MNHLMIVGTLPDSRQMSLDASEHHAVLTAIKERRLANRSSVRGQRLAGNC